MKIGIVTEFYYPLLGGITENVHNTRIRLREMGHEVKIVTSRVGRGDLMPDASGKDPEIIRIGRSVPVLSNGSFSRVTVGTRLYSRMAEVMEKERFDLLHIHSPLSPVLPWIALQVAPCPAVGTFHTYFDRSLAYALFRRKIQSRGIDRLRGRIAVAESCVQALARYVRFDARILPNGVDTDLFTPEHPPLEAFRDGKKNLLFVGRFDPRNGLRLMLHAFEIIRKEHGNVRLIVVGRGPFGRYYEPLLPARLRKDVVFVGPALAERPALYATCDVFCSPVSKASFGVTLLEAMASGRPIVATENVGYRALLGGEEGVLVPPHDPLFFARAVLRLLDDDDLRRRLGRNGREKALRFSWDKITVELADYYGEVLGRS